MTKTNTKAAATTKTAKTTRRMEPAQVRSIWPEGVDRPLTEVDKLTAFRTATRGFEKHFAAEIAAGMSDIELEDALGRTLGIMGGCCGPGELDVSFQGNGLRIWASWTIENHHKTQPIFAGRSTVAMAREVYGVANPQDRQMRLF